MINNPKIQVPPTMKASVYREFGGPEVLRYEEIPTPEPTEGEALVKVLAVAIDYIQLHIRHGGSGRIGSSGEAHYGNQRSTAHSRRHGVCGGGRVWTQYRRSRNWHTPSGRWACDRDHTSNTV